MRASLFQRQLLVQGVLAFGTNGAGAVVASGKNKIKQKISKTTRDDSLTKLNKQIELPPRVTSRI